MTYARRATVIGDIADAPCCHDNADISRTTERPIRRLALTPIFDVFVYGVDRRAEVIDDYLFLCYLLLLLSPLLLYRAPAEFGLLLLHLFYIELLNYFTTIWPPKPIILPGEGFTLPKHIILIYFSYISFARELPQPVISASSSISYVTICE